MSVHNDRPPVPSQAEEFTARLLKSKERNPNRSFAALAIRDQAPEEKCMIACMVTHGMGQQVPFETVSQVGEAFVRGRTPRSVQANRVVLPGGTDLISRMEIVYDPYDGSPETHIHLYEGYWAPLTEGKIGFLATISFLLDGAGEGFKSLLRPAHGQPSFDRWIFGRLRKLPIKPGTAISLLLTVLALLLALVLLYLCENRLQSVYNNLRPYLGTSMTSATSKLWNLLLLKVVHGWDMLKSGTFLTFFVKLFSFFSAPIAVLVSAIYVYFVRYAVIEYVGDVAIYVSAYKVSAYEQVRQAIQKTVFDVGSRIFQATNSSEGAGYLYDEVLFLGHSLGSVITYDLINALIVWDVFQKNSQYDVVGRTKQLITFGSPLDKTAFLFRTQISPEHHYREALAALQQPIILDYTLRPFSWINLYSHADIISASLIYYDIPKSESHPPDYNPVDNRYDHGAWKPLLAHNQYWTGELLRDLLQQAIR